MKRLFILIASILAAFALQAQPAPGPRVKVLVDNDLCGDGDGLFHLVHQLLCNSSDVRGIVGAHVGARSRAWGQSESEGARLIIEEAHKASPERPLYLLFGGPLTDIASAWLMDPSISKNVILLWIGGQEYDFGHPFPPEHFRGNNLVEYNLRLDIKAAQTVFNDSDLTIWQIPRDVYRQCMYSIAELDDKIAPLGKIGEYLCSRLGGFARMADTYVLGDSPLCLISTLTTTFEPGAASSFYEKTAAPAITESGLYDFSEPGREIIVYKTVDTRLLFGDMESRFRLF